MFARYLAAKTIAKIKQSVLLLFIYKYFTLALSHMPYSNDFTF